MGQDCAVKHPDSLQAFPQRPFFFDRWCLNLSASSGAGCPCACSEAPRSSAPHGARGCSGVFAAGGAAAEEEEAAIFEAGSCFQVPIDALLNVSGSRAEGDPLVFPLPLMCLKGGTSSGGVGELG